MKVGISALVGNLDFPTRLLFGALTGLLLSLIEALLLGNGLAIQIVIIIFFALMNLALLMRAPGLFLFYFLVFYSGIGMLIANALLSGSVYITEADYTSYDIGALPLLVATLTVFFLAFCFVAWNFDRPVPPRQITSSLESWLCLAVAAAPLAVSGLAFVIYGSPWAAGQSRSAFWALGNVPQIFFTLGFNRLGPTVLIAGIVFYLSRDRTIRRLCLGVGILNVIILVLFGGRANALVSPAILFTLATAFGLRRLQGKLLRRMLFYGGLAVGAVVALTLASYAFQFTSTTGERSTALVGLFTRIVLQGHVWWNIYYTVNISHIGDTGASFWNEINTFLDWSPSRSGRGSDLVMRLIAPKVLYESAVEQDIIFAGGWPALGLYYFGPVALQIFQVFAGMAYAAFGLLLKKEVVRGHYISALILYFIWWQFLSEAVLNAEWYLIFNIRPMAFMLLYLAMRLASARLPKLFNFALARPPAPLTSAEG